MEEIGRKDLSVGAKSIQWLFSNRTVEIGERTKTVKSFVRMLREEMEMKDWRFIVQTKLGPIQYTAPNIEFEKVLSYCVEGGVFSPNLSDLCKLMDDIERVDMKRKIQEYQPVLLTKSNKQLIKELKMELRENRK